MADFNEHDWFKKFGRVRMCVDRVVPTTHALKFAKIAVKENPDNEPEFLNRPLGVIHPLRIALVTGKKWQDGRTIKIGFMDGTQQQRDFVKKVSVRWLDYADLAFAFGDANDAEVRISFSQPGSWSFIGTDCLGIPKNQPTMNFGWQDEATVLHEFGHMAGALHEHQHPQAVIPWNKAVVYQYFAGPPNNWDRQTVDVNIFQKYSATLTNFSAYDRTSIMHYPVDPALTNGQYSVGWNKDLSQLDKSFMASSYPKDSGPTAGGGGQPSNPILPGSGTFRFTTVEGKPALIFG
jgi:hypothetical protein